MRAINGEYWPQAVAIQTESSEVSKKTIKGQNSPVQFRASEVSKLFIIRHGFFEQLDTSTLGDHVCNLRLPSVNFER